VFFRCHLSHYFRSPLLHDHEAPRFGCCCCCSEAAAAAAVVTGLVSGKAIERYATLEALFHSLDDDDDDSIAKRI
jgi:hypothetical protein